MAIEVAKDGGETTIQGRRPAPPPSSGPVLRMEPSHNFGLLTHPMQWDVAIVGGKATIVPRLRVFRFEPGLAGVIGIKNSFDGDPDAALGVCKKRGWTMVPRDRSVKAWGNTVDDYAVLYDGHRGPVHLTAWQRPLHRGGQVIVDFDEDGWLAYLVGLVGTVVDAPDRIAKRSLEMQLNTHMRKVKTSAERNAGAEAHADLLALKVKVFRPTPTKPAPDAPPKENP